MKGIKLFAAVSLVALSTSSAFATSNEAFGTIFGAISAGVTANQISKDKPTNIKNRNTVLATAAGGFLGNWIGSQLDTKEQQSQVVSEQQNVINAEYRKELTFTVGYKELFKPKTTSMKQEAVEQLSNICAQGNVLHVVLDAKLPKESITDYVDCVGSIKRSPSLKKAVEFTVRKAP